MHQAVATTSGTIEVQDVEVPQFASDEILVRSVLVGICGSDTHAMSGDHPFLYPPYVPGHEAVGLVEKVGAEVDGISTGDRVLLKPNLTCGKCKNCQAGRTNACQELRWIGCDPSGELAGAMAEYFVAPATNLFVLPANVSDETGVLVECLSTPVHAVAQAGDLRGSKIVIVGAGTIGLLTLVAALHAGAETAVIIDMDPGKIDRALGQGATAGVLSTAERSPVDEVLEILGSGADVVFDCVAHEATVDQALHMLRRSGSLMIVGVPPRTFNVALPLVQDWEIRIQGCAAYTGADIENALEIAKEGLLPTEAIVTERYSLQDANAAFEAASKNSSGKVLVAC